ncbi:MAG TPA: hypothetical protein VHQ65_16335 [Thermoanaerobaculia bacterium]|nr:hypothetical protein [Thermoanaerobaculia bacterium]
MTASDLPAALAQWAAERPQAPWLFHPEGLDWRWLSFAAAAAEVERLAAASGAALAAAGVAPPAAVSFVYEPRPAPVLLDLALQRAGFTAAPQPPGEAPRHPVLPPEVLAATGDERCASGGEEVPGGVEVRTAAGAALTVSAGELAASAAALEEAIAAAGPLRRPEREIVVAGPDLADPVERRILAWSLLQGAAVLLEPSALGRPGTAAWARPTVFHGTADELEFLFAEAEQHDREGFAGLLRRLGHAPTPDLPFRRLHTLLTHPVPHQEAWERRGVRWVDPS